MKEPTSQLLREADAWLRARSRDDRFDLDFDVEAGLARHRALVESGATLPEWSRGLEPPRARGWLGAKLALLGLLTGITLFALLRQAPSPSGTAQTPISLPGPAAGSASDPAISVSPSRVLAARGVTPLPRVSALSPASGSAPVLEPTPHSQPDATSQRVAPVAPIPARRSSRHTGVGHRLTAAANTDRYRARRGRVEADGSNRARDSVTAEEPFDAEEMQQVARAERLLQSDPAAALALVRAGELRFRGGYFSQERRYLEVMSLVALRRPAEARAQGWAFMRDYRSGAYARAVESVLAGLPE